MEYGITIFVLILLVSQSYQACQEKAGLTECLNTPVRRQDLETISPQTVTLSLKHGPLNSEIAPATFRHLPNLENLYLSFDNIKRLQPGCFQGLANLKELYLTNNELEEIPSGVFDTCRRLRILRLNLNKIKTVASDSFDELAQLEELDLSSNALEQLPNLRTLVSLRELNLGYNKLTVVGSGAFSSLTRLESLKLNDNRIAALHTNAFQGLSNLLELDIRSNYLTELDVSNMLQSARKLRSISISLNDFRCSTLRNILSQLQQRNVQVVQGVSRSPNAINGISCKQ